MWPKGHCVVIGKDLRVISRRVATFDVGIRILLHLQYCFKALKSPNPFSSHSSWSLGVTWPRGRAAALH